MSDMHNEAIGWSGTKVGAVGSPAGTKTVCVDPFLLAGDSLRCSDTAFEEAHDFPGAHDDGEVRGEDGEKEVEHDVFREAEMPAEQADGSGNNRIAKHEQGSVALAVAGHQQQVMEMFTIGRER